MRTETDTHLAPAPPRASQRMGLLRLVLLAAILAAFGRTLGNHFVDWDDSKLIYANPNINNPTLDGLKRQWDPRDPDGLAMYNPLVYAAWWALAQTPRLSTPDMLGATLNPFPYHAANLLVHWLTACLVLQILIRLGLPEGPAVIGALLFAVHPLQTEAVAWATGMKDLLSGLFTMAAILAYMRAVQSVGTHRRNNYIAATLFCVAALLAKPSAVSLPLIVVAMDVIWFGRPLRTALAWISPWLILSAATMLVAQHIQPTSDLQNVPLWARPLIAADSLGFYLVKLVVPSDLTFEYARTPSALLAGGDLHYALYWTWILPVAVGLIVWRIGSRTLNLAAMIFFLGVLPVLGFTSFIFQYHSTVADRYVYVSMLGAAIAAAWLLAHAKTRPAWAGACAVLVVFASLSFAQAGRWQDTESLYEYGLKLHIASPMHLFVLGQYKDKESEMAERNAQTELQKKYLEQAIDAYGNALQMDPEFGQVYRNLTVDLIRAGRIDEAISVTRRRIDAQPRLPQIVRDKPAKLHATLGMLLYRVQRYAEAAAEFERSLADEPNQQVSQTLAAARRLLDASRPATDSTK